ncbi:MAG: Hsp70 family protein [Pirellulales bacterium]|nr:Hsp70 family protein [Pirellulales bacterium]
MSAVIPVGIDLGTTNCAASYVDSEGRTKMIPTSTGDVLTPSVVYFHDDAPIAGQSAWEAALTAPDRVIENAKRDMGSAACRQSVAGEHYPPEVVQGCLLRQLLRDVTAIVGEEFQAVVTVPAYFDEARRKAAHDAAIMSGLPLLDIVNEPTAAALSFGERLGYLRSDGAPQAKLNILAYDLGGGTFDVTVIRLSPGEVRTLATDGDCELGGINWDERLVGLALERVPMLQQRGTTLTQVEQIALRRAARDAKHALSDRPATLLECRVGEAAFAMPVTREEFEELTADLLERTLFTTKQALQAAGLIWDEVDRLLLVGGSSRMPAVRRALEQASGLQAEVAVHPDEAVARGAAIFARYLLGLRGRDDVAPALSVVDVNAHGLGIEGVNLQTLRTENVTLIPRNTPLPCEVVRKFVTRSDGQPNVRVQLLEGESTVPSQCAPLATALIKNLPPGLPQGTPIDVHYSLQSNGRLAVRAAVQGFGSPARIELQRVRGLAERRVQRWKQVVCRDGGFRNFQEVLAVMANDPPAGGKPETLESETRVENRRQGGRLSGPAVAYGAPQAAAETLQAQLNPTRSSGSAAAITLSDPEEAGSDAADIYAQPAPTSRRRRGNWINSAVNLTGHVLAAFVGLFVGYYLLCIVRPELNYFRLNLPGVAAPSEIRR